MPEYKVLAHRRVIKFLKSLQDERLKARLKEALAELQNYPIALRRLDVEKLEGLKRAYRVRVGEYRIIFLVDKEDKTIYITHIGRRESIYENLTRF
ncbi:type II toxin-antitoxin system RelE/ParE family toxin [Candidatus Bathyarchaeota archaeon]|nr:MAG: type II toxin-antitoxin system RelE/ParE family toxin [Candidatus Bathyarchaeota archaeon]